MNTTDYRSGSKARFFILFIVFMIGLLVCVSTVSATENSYKFQEIKKVQAGNDRDNRSSSSDQFHDPFRSENNEMNYKKQGKPGNDISDPLETINRWTFDANMMVFEHVGKPIARAYRDYTPRALREGVRNSFRNLYEPTHAINATIQGDLEDADTSASRFLINTTFGAGGFYDVAGQYLNRVPHDFDQTLGEWGADPYFYIVWPFYGPSSARGTIGTLVDSSFDPINHIDSSRGTTAASVYRIISETSYELDRFESLKRFTVDPYSAVKDVYEKRVYKKIHSGK